MLAGASATFTNAIVDCNEAATDGGGLFTETSGTATFVNTVLYENVSSETGTSRGSQAWIGASTSLHLTNSIVEGTTSVALLYGIGSGSLTYDDVHNASGESYGGALSAGEGTISSGGNFTSVVCDGDAFDDDFSLVAGSSAVDAGNPDAAYADVDGTVNDLGAFGGPAGSW